MKFRDDLDKPEANKNFISLKKDKESVIGTFRGDPHIFYVAWENGKSREVDQDYPGSKMRFRINFIIKDGASYVVKIFENSATVYHHLKELHEVSNLETTAIKIIRNGTGLDTSYLIVPLQQITKEVSEHLKTLELNKLGKDKPLQNVAPKFDHEENVPF